LRDASANQQAATTTTLEKEVSLTVVMTKDEVCERSAMDKGVVGDRWSDPPIDRAMEMTRAVTCTATETVVATMFELLDTNDNGNQRSISEAPASTSNLRSRMERTMGQQPQELTQLHQTVGHLTNLVQV
jgi:hypothetical protein